MPIPKPTIIRPWGVYQTLLNIWRRRRQFMSQTNNLELSSTYSSYCPLFFLPILSTFINLLILFFPLPLLPNPALGLSLYNQRLLMTVLDGGTNSLCLHFSSSTCLGSGKGADVPHKHGLSQLTPIPFSKAPSITRHLQNTKAGIANLSFKCLPSSTCTCFGVCIAFLCFFSP